MFKLTKKAKFSKKENKMKNFGNIEEAIKNFEKGKNKNLYYVLKQRFEWMNKYIKEDEIGLEVGAGAGFSKKFIKNKNLKISDFSNHEHLDYKNVDAHNTNFNNNTFDYVIAAHVLHHVPYPMKFFREIHRILKKDGKLLIHEEYLSVFLQIILIVMKHEGFDWTKNIWNESAPATDEEDLWSGNNAIPHLVFDDITTFDKYLGNYFKIDHDKVVHHISYLNSGGVTAKTFYIPLNNFFLSMFDKIYSILSKPFPKIFGLNRCLVLVKK